jgi:hypothetical protein
MDKSKRNTKRLSTEILAIMLQMQMHYDGTKSLT